MKGLSLPLLLLLCLTAPMTQAQQPEGIEALRMNPRANVVTYDDDNAVERLLYDASPYYLSLEEGWHSSEVNGSKELTQEYEFPKDWKSYRVFFRMQARPGYGLFVGEQLIGVSHDASAITEFDISEQVRFGRSSRLSLRFVGEDEGALLESFPYDRKGEDVANCALLLKPLQNIQDYTLTAEYNPTTQQGSYNIEVDLYNHRKKGKCYVEVEVWDYKGHQVDKLGKWCFFDKRSENTQNISSDISSVMPWNAEVPRLYTAVVRLYDEKMERVDMVGTRFGFRTMRGDVKALEINGKRITLKGVSLRVGRLNTQEKVKALRAQMVAMKCHNVNAIRLMGDTPSSEKFYELCDELGFYVVKEAHLFPTSTMGHAVATDNDFAGLFADRVRSMYGQLKNHPCIVAWSLGSCPDNGVCMHQAYRTLKQLDPHRMVLYPGAQYADNTDMIASDGCNTEQLGQYLSKNPPRSLVMNSYGSAVGNNFGGMSAMWQRVLDHTQIQGGFFDVQDWEPFATKPYSAELKQLYRPIDVQITSTSADAAEFLIINLCDFRPLADYRLEYVIYTNLKSNIVSGDVTMSLKAGESKEFKLKVPKLLLYTGEELFIKFTLRQRSNTPTVPKNTLLSFSQFVLPSDNMPKLPYVDYGGTPFTIEKDTTHRMHIFNNLVSLVFDDSTGLLTSLSYKGHELLTSASRLNFMREPTPNDLADPNGVKQWIRYEKGAMNCSLLATNCKKIDEKSVGIDVMFRYSSNRFGHLFDTRQSYLILSSGDVLMSNHITVSDQIKSVARVGIQFGFNEALTTAEWFGRNVESYVDRRLSGQIAQQSLPVDQLTYRYLPPEHGGNYAETRWLALHNESVGLYVDILDTLLNFSVDGDTLNIDYRMAGVGSAVGGLPLAEKDLVKDRKHHFTLHLRPYDPIESNAQDFRRIAYPKVESNIVEMPVISKGRSQSGSPMLITIACPTPQSRVYYTLDGTEPTEKAKLYTKPFGVQSSVVVKARAYKTGEAPSFVAEEQVSFGHIVSCAFSHKPNTPYNKNAAKALFDGELGDVNDLSRGWLGFSGRDIQIDLELGKATHIGNVKLRFAHVPDAWVFAPKEVLVAVSSDGSTFSDYVPAAISYDAASDEMNTTQLQVLTVPIGRSDVRFVRVLAKPIARIPQWHRAKGLKPWLMIDEVEVNEIIEK